MTMKMKLAALATVAVALLWSLPVHASTVTIGLGPNPLLNIVAGPNASGNATFSGASGGFLLNNVDVTGNPPLPNPQLLGSSSFNVSGGAGTLDVWVTSQGNMPLGPSFLSTLTTNVLTAGWSVELKTWVDATNAQFGTATLIADHTFNDIGTAQVPGVAGLNSTYSITAEYIITATSPGSANSTIDVFSAPEPSSLLLLGTGLLGLGFSLRRKHI